MAEALNIRRSLLGKILMVTLAPTFVFLAIISFYFYFQARASLEDEMGRRLVGIARNAAAQIEPTQAFTFMPGDETTRTYRALSDRNIRLAEANDVKRIYVVDFEHKVIFNTERGSKIGEKMYHLGGHRREVKRVRLGRAVATKMFAGVDNLLYMAGYAPLLLDGEVVAMVGVDADVRFFDRLSAIRRNLVLIGLASLLAFAGAGVIFARRLANPIRRLARSAARIGEGDYDTPIAEKTGDEIELLADTLNDMRKSIVKRERELHMMQRGIAHEVRNPLGGMELYCGILTDELGDRPDLIPHVVKIEREITALEQVVTEFLDFTKEQVPDVRRVLLNEYFAELMMVYAVRCEARKIQLVEEIGANLETAYFDPDLIRRVLHNLLRNAIQAMPGGGRLEVAVDMVGRDLQISIADTGKGITPENLANVFSPFYTTKQKGTGLGLPFARKIVENHGGSLTLRSRTGHGTGVILRLPQPESEEGE